MCWGLRESFRATVANESLVNEKRLETKYKGVCFFEDDDRCVYRVIGVEWIAKARSSPAHYQLLTIKLEDASDPDQDKQWGYFINEVLHDLIKQCPDEHNNAFKMIEWLLCYIDIVANKNH